MTTWSFYRPTGELLSRRYSGPASALSENTPEDTIPVAGEFDHLSQRVNPTTGEVFDWQPPQPDERHVWNPQTKRWVIDPEIAARESAVLRLKSQILELEERQQRPLREFALGDETALARVRDIDQQISTLRAQLNG